MIIEQWPDVKRFVTFLKARRQERGAEFRFAVVASQPATYGISHLYQALVSDLPEEVRVFRSMAEARQWLANKE
ncbi:MAG: hypothetical protein JW953_17225 [Anaerolineae bacterium]|nr:hypothetical protein [Anaerolineae bacterium]